MTGVPYRSLWWGAASNFAADNLVNVAGEPLPPVPLHFALQMVLHARDTLLITAPANSGMPACSLAVHVVVPASFWRCCVHSLHCPGATNLRQV